MTAQDTLQGAYLETGDLAKDMLQPYVDELDLPPEMRDDGRQMTNAEIVNRMDRQLRFRNLRYGEDGRLVQPPASRMPLFQGRDAFIRHIESARAAGDTTKVDFMQATLKSFDTYVSGRMQQALDHAEEFHQWDGIPLAGHIDQPKLLAELNGQQAALSTLTVVDPQEEADMIKQVSYYVYAIYAVERGLDPTPALAELQSARNFGDQVNFILISDVRLAVKWIGDWA